MYGACMQKEERGPQQIDDVVKSPSSLSAQLDHAGADASCQELEPSANSSASGKADMTVLSNTAAPAPGVPQPPEASALVMAEPEVELLSLTRRQSLNGQ